MHIKGGLRNANPPKPPTRIQIKLLTHFAGIIESAPPPLIVLIRRIPRNVNCDLHPCGRIRLPAQRSSNVADSIIEISADKSRFNFAWVTFMAGNKIMLGDNQLLVCALGAYPCEARSVGRVWGCFFLFIYFLVRLCRTWPLRI